MLPPVKEVKREKLNFPQFWQTVIFRNYGYVKTENLAKTLRIDCKTVEREALRLGLENVTYNKNWEERGYITIIRNNWNILPYEQILTLLDINAERLEYILVNDDFLSVKLGNFKPMCAEVVYSPLTEDDIRATKEIAETVRANRIEETARPFAFFEPNEGGRYEINASEGVRIVHGYLAPCGDAFIEESDKYMPDSLLLKYAENGINGLWFHGVLSALSPYPFDESLSKDYAVRRKNLKDLITRARGFGIKIYLYFNEPRALAEEKFGKYSYLMGRRENGFAALCFEHAETQRYLYEAIKDLFSEIPEIGGVITITMSENLTHCHYRQNTNCPVCKNIPPEETVAKVNNTIMRAMRDAGSNAELLANRWGWSSFCGWSREQSLRCIDLLDKEVALLSVSEDELPIEKGGVKSIVRDYSIGNIGPSAITVDSLERAKAKGHNVYAKVQVNNSWECSAVPYLPLFDLFYEHFYNLSKINVTDYMLTWTLGGYPSPTFDLCAEFIDQGKNFDLDGWYKKHYGNQSEEVHKAVKCFCAGFVEYPFGIDCLYFSPKTLGPSNLWDWEEEKKVSTMVCYAYDDYETWIKPYSYEAYISQMEKLLRYWEEGLQILNRLELTPILKELKTYAEVAYIHFQADLHQTQFSFYKRNKKKYVNEIAKILTMQLFSAKRLLRLIAENSYVGYETSNHYFYTERNLLEKLLNLKALMKN